MEKQVQRFTQIQRSTSEIPKKEESLDTGMRLERIPALPKEIKELRHTCRRNKSERSTFGELGRMHGHKDDDGPSPSSIFEQNPLST